MMSTPAFASLFDISFVSSSGKAQSITIDDNERMSDAEIERAIRDAQEYAAQDSIRSQALEANNEANQLLNRVQQAMQERKKDLGKEDRHFLKNDIAELSRVVSRNNPAKATDAELQAVKTATENLKQSSSRILGL